MQYGPSLQLLFSDVGNHQLDKHIAIKKLEGKKTSNAGGGEVSDNKGSVRVLRSYAPVS